MTTKHEKIILLYIFFFPYYFSGTKHNLKENDFIMFGGHIENLKEN